MTSRTSGTVEISGMAEIVGVSAEMRVTIPPFEWRKRFR